MAEYISREAAIDCLHFVCVPQCRQYAQEEIKKIPAANVRPVVRGEWTDHRTIEHDGEWYCTACGKEITIYMGADGKDRYAFCPNCGSDMRGGEQDENKL